MSGLGIAKKVTRGEYSGQYCAQVYFTVKSQQDHRYYCHFVVTKNLEMCLAVVKRKFQQEYDIAPPITFAGDHIVLYIPDDGIQTDNGWKIVPVHNTHIKKEQVDNFSSESSWVPECVLLVEWLYKDKTPEPLNYKVQLLGTRDENDFFRINYDPEVTRHQSTFSDGSMVYSQVPTLKDLLTALYRKVAHKWKAIGVYLEIRDLDSIETRHHNDPHLCLLEMLDAWLKRVDPPPTWTAITEAVEFLGEEQLGSELRKKYTVQPPME